MTRNRRNTPPRPAPTPTAAPQTKDSFVNFQARLGLGAGSIQDGGHYQNDFISRNRTNLEAAYRTNWVCGQVVDLVAQDMTRAGIEITSTMTPDDIEALTRAIERMQIWNKICDTIKWARLYGGALAVILIDGQLPNTPLKLDTILPGAFKGLMVLDRWQVTPSLTDPVTEYGPDMGEPRYYNVLQSAQGMANQKVHYSRVLRIDGIELPYWQKIAENGWGESVIERMYDRIIAFDSTSEGAAQLVHKAYLRTYKIEGLRDIIATGGKAFDGLLKQIEMIRQFQSSEGLTLMDAKDSFETHSYTFAGLDDVMMQFSQQLSGATQIPLVRLLGQSPGGLNNSGESDIRTYYDNINQQQERKLRSGLTRMLEVLVRSELEQEPPEGFTFSFSPLWQMTPEQKAAVANTTADAVSKAEGAGIISQQTALKELRQSSHITGIFSNISDEDIEQAETEPPPPDMGLTDEPGGSDEKTEASNFDRD